MLRRGRVVSADAAIDALWPAGRRGTPRPPCRTTSSGSAAACPTGSIESTGDGYRLEPPRIDLDADRLAAALQRRTPRRSATLATIDAVLDAVARPGVPGARRRRRRAGRAARLDELRLRALEARAERRLAAGDTDGLVAELAALADDEPLRERPRALLMAALAATGRHAEALRVYDDFRRLLGDELGIEPSPALAAQHAELLAGAGGVTAWAPASRLPVPATSLVGRDDARRRGRRRWSTATGWSRWSDRAASARPGCSSRSATGCAAARPDRPVVLCELATATEESAVDVVAAALGDRRPPGRRLAERVAAVLGDTELVLLLDNCEHVLDPVAELVDRLLARCPNVTRRGDEPGAAAGAGRAVCAVPTAAVGRRRRGRPSQLFVERARAVAPGFEPEPASWRRSPRSCAASTGCRWPSSWPRPACTPTTWPRWPPASTTASRCCRRVPHLVPPRLARRRRVVVVRAARRRACSGSSPTCRCSPGRSPSPTRRPSAASTEAVTAALAQLVERSLVLRAPDRRYVLLETLRAFGAEQLAADGRADASRASATPTTRSPGSSRRPPAARAGPTAIAEIDAAIPELRTALGWLLDHDEVEPPVGWSPPCSTTASCGCAPTCWRGPSGWPTPTRGPQPDGARVWAVARVRRVDGRRHRPRPACAARGRCGSPSGPAATSRPRWPTICGNVALFEGRLDDAARGTGEPSTRPPTIRRNA